MKLPVLYNHDGTPKRPLHPLALSVSFSLRNMHTASMTLPFDEQYVPRSFRSAYDPVRMHDMVLITMPDDTVWMFRVASVKHTVRGATEYTLNHAIDLLNDSVWAAKTTSRGRLSAFLTSLLSYQSFWAMGDNETDSATMWYRQDIAYDKLSDLFGEIRDSLSLHYMEYTHTLNSDSTVTSLINIRQMPTIAGAEFRLSRNITNCNYTRSDADMCNRLYIKYHNTSGASTYNVYTYEDADSITNYGAVAGSVEVNGDELNATGSAGRDEYAAAFFALYAKPRLTISIDGLELSRLTGLSWDAMSVGKLVRVSLPDYNETYEERCASVTYPNLLGEPERITVELGEHQDRLTEITEHTRKKQSSGWDGHYIYGQMGEPSEEED